MIGQTFADKLYTRPSFTLFRHCKNKLARNTPALQKQAC